MVTDPGNTVQHATAAMNRMLMKDPESDKRHDWTGYQHMSYEVLLGLENDPDLSNSHWDRRRELFVVLQQYATELGLRL